MKIQEILAQGPVVPVIVIERIEDAVPLANALVKGGLRVLEVTLRTPVALEAISAIKEAVPEAIVGAGTIITGEDLDAACKAGAEFLVSPGTSESLLNAAANSSVPLLPGAATPSEAMKLLEAGYAHQKFFPAEAAGGTAMLKSIGGPLPQITFCPTGGINPEKAKAYLALANVACVGGSWMVDKKLVTEGNWQEIEKLAKQASGLSA